ncbi:hypothetical protein ACFXTN_015364 [Malus domestica]
MFDGMWVRDDSYPLYAPGSYPFIDESFNCFLNKRPDNCYEKYRWQPKHCNLPRLDGKNMLGLLRGKRLVFVGDSLNRNMWESLLCLLRNSMDDKSGVVEALVVVAAMLSPTRSLRAHSSLLHLFLSQPATSNSSTKASGASSDLAKKKTFT